MFSVAEELISDIFSLQHREECRISSPSEPCKLLSDFIDKDDLDWAGLDLPSRCGEEKGESVSESVIAILQYARGVLTGGETNTHVEWWLEYGCALLCAPGVKGAAKPTRTYSLIGLDGWKSKIHSYLDADGRAQRVGTSICTDSTVLYAATVGEEAHDEFIGLIHEVLTEASK
jgi:hypothetical protein